MNGLAKTFFLVGTLLILSTVVGCATTDSASQPACCQNSTLSESLPVLSQVERGKPRPVIDGIGWAFGIPSKLLLWDRRAENHDVSLATEQKLVEYANANGLQDSKIRINQYAPISEWNRLRDNKKITPGIKYTMGTLSVIGYSLFPGRLFGTDSYNPYTDTINIYSDIPSLAIEQAAHSKDIWQHEWPGVNSIWRNMPLVDLHYESKAKADVVEYVAMSGSKSELGETQKIMNAQYGREVGREVGSFVAGAEPIGEILGAVTGHTVTHVQAMFLESPENVSRSLPQNPNGVLQRPRDVENPNGFTGG